MGSTTIVYFVLACTIAAYTTIPFALAKPAERTTRSSMKSFACQGIEESKSQTLPWGSSTISCSGSIPKDDRIITSCYLCGTGEDKPPKVNGRVSSIKVRNVPKTAEARVYEKPWKLKFTNEKKDELTIWVVVTNGTNGNARVHVYHLSETWQVQQVGQKV